MQTTDTVDARSAHKGALRGTKRLCLHDECGENFYDLNKDPIACPYCAAPFVVVAQVVTETRASRKRPQYRLEKPQPVIDTSQEADSNEDESADAADLADDLDDTSGAQALLDNEADDDGATDAIDPPPKDDAV